MTQTTENQFPVNFARTIAIFLVIVIHASIEPLVFSQPSGSQSWMWWTSNIYDSISRFSVPIFLLVSGFLLLQPSKLNESPPFFYKKRFMRVGIPLLFWAGIYLGWRLFVHGESWSVIGQNLSLQFPYFNFTFLYLLIGLYLITPLLRSMMLHSNPRIMKSVISLCFLSSAVLISLCLLRLIQFNPELLFFIGWLGYFLLGYYFSNLKVKVWLSSSMILFGFLLTVIGTWAITLANGGQFNEILYQYISPNIVLMSVGAFLLFNRLPLSRLQTRFPKISTFTDIVGQYTLAIYMFFSIVLETLQRGLLGFQINASILNPIIEIPLVSLMTLGICLAVFIPLKRFPMVGTLVGLR